MGSFDLGASRRRAGVAGFVLAAMLPVGAIWAAQVQFAVTYADGANEGFNDPILGTARKSAFTYALDQWSGVLNSSFAGETIRVTAQFDPIGGEATSATLGFAGPTQVFNLAPVIGINLWGPAALAAHIAGGNINSNPQINATFNTDVDGNTVLGGTNFYYGTDGNVGGHIDFATVALHEIGHGLGFGSSLDETTGLYDVNGDTVADLPTIYDYFLGVPTGPTTAAQLVALTPAERIAAVTSGDLFWLGADAADANGGDAVKLYAPSTFEPGSSVSHIDEATFPFALMSPQYSGVLHSPTAIDRGMLSDILWSVNPIPEPASLAVLALAGGAMLRRRRAKCA